MFFRHPHATKTPNAKDRKWQTRADPWGRSEGKEPPVSLEPGMGGIPANGEDVGEILGQK